MSYLYQELEEKKRREARFKRNEDSRKRLAELSGVSSKTSSFLNVKEDLKGTIKAAKAILDPKHSEEEYQILLSYHDIQNTDNLKDIHSKITDNLDPIYKRHFNKYLEILLLKKHNALARQVQNKNKPVVTFSENTIKENELCLKNEVNKLRQRVI